MDMKSSERVFAVAAATWILSLPAIHPSQAQPCDYAGYHRPPSSQEARLSTLTPPASTSPFL